MKKLLIIVLIIGLALLLYLMSKNGDRLNMSSGETQSETVAPDGPILDKFKTESMEEAEQKALELSRGSRSQTPPDASVQTETDTSAGMSQ